MRRSRQDVVDLLSLAKDKDGKQINVDSYDNESLKTIDQLLDEWSERDVVLKIDPVTHRLWRRAMTVKLIVVAGRYQLHETKRGYRNNSIIIPKPRRMEHK